MTSLADLPLRDNLRGLTPYGAPQLQVKVSLNVNENTHPIPPEVANRIQQAIAAEISGLNRYPDREFLELRESLVGYLGQGLSAENIWAGNGSNEVIQHIFQAFGGPGRKGLSFSPSYSMYSLIASATETAWVNVPRPADYRVDAELVKRAIAEHNPDLIFFCAPNNPTGTGQDLDAIVAAYEGSSGIIVVDEAYAEFSHDNANSALSLLADRPRLVVLRTMSKAFAFAGARLGYLAGDPAFTDALRLVRLPYHLSSLTQAAAIAALAEAETMLATVDDIKFQRDRIVSELSEMGFSPFPSETNFVLFGGISDSHEAFEGLLSQEILVRDLGIPHHLRVSAGTAEETDAFLKAIPQFLAR
ncbi:MAG: histidinol-phosphate transaminase [Microbacteriaceae bacterium]